MQLYRSRVQKTISYEEYTIREDGSIRSQTGRIADFGIASTFNNPIIIGNHVNSCAYLFEGCTNYNCPVDIPVNVNKTTNMFAFCSNFNSDVNITNRMICNMDNMFSGCVNLNKNIQINASLFEGYGNYMFQNCWKFNQPINIVNVIYTMRMFDNCISLNSNIQCSETTMRTNSWMMFHNCTNLNQRISIEYYTNTIGMFRNCFNLNQMFVRDEYPTNCQMMFANCNNLNKTVGWGMQGGTSFNAWGMLEGCTKFNQDITIPNTCIDIGSLLWNCKDFAKTVYIKGTTARTLNVSYMLMDCNNSKRKNIRFHPSLDSLFRQTTASTSIVGKGITWTNLTNGFYNSLYNIYCYNDYSG